MAGGKNGAVPQKRLTKDELLKSLGRRTGEYTVAGLGTIQLQSLNVKNAALAFPGTDDDSSERLKRICLLGIVEPKLEPEDLESLNEANAGAVTQIVNRVLELSGLSGESAVSFLTLTPPSKA